MKKVNIYILMLELAWIGTYFLKLLGIAEITWRQVFIPVLIVIGITVLSAILTILISDEEKSNEND